MNQPSSSPSLFGLSFGWAYALAAFTLTITSCLPLALLATMAGGGTGAERANALMAWLPIMAALAALAALVAIACAVFFFTTLRQRVGWQRHVLMAMWALSALGMVGWWKL